MNDKIKQLQQSIIEMYPDASEVFIKINHEEFKVEPVYRQNSKGTIMMIGEPHEEVTDE